MINMNKKLKQALAFQENGELRKAEAAFRQILKKDESDLVSQYSLGVIVLKLGDLSGALNYFDNAAKLKPDFAQTWFNRGIVLQQMRRDAEALESYDRALEIDSAYSQAQTNRDALSVMIGNQNVSSSAVLIKTLEEMRMKALQLQANDQLAEARALFVQILGVSSTEFVSLYSMAVIELRAGNPLDALMYADRATVVNPMYAPVWYNKGTILYALKRNEEALADFDRALNLDSSYAEPLINRGAVLQELNRHIEAVDNFNRLLAIDPENEKALVNKGILLTQFKRYDEAIIEFEKLLKINSSYEYILGQLCFAYLHICSWEKLEELSSLIREGIRAGKRVCNSLALMAISDVAQDHLLCAQIYSTHKCPPAHDKIWRGERYNHEKIRLAYISPDLRQHPVGHLMAGIFEHHDKSKFEIISISLGTDDQSSLRRRFVDASDKFIDAKQMNSKDIAVLMRSLEVDIAVDLAGYTADSRSDLFALRPAPIQVNYLGYAGTMGVEYIDYILADRHVIPSEDCVNFSEKVVYLPDTYLPTDGTLRLADRMPTREEYGLPSTGFIFCSFNHDYKINPPMFDVWMRLLKRVSGSILWLMKLNSSAEANLIKEAGARGVDPGRMIFATRVPTVEDHLARYQLADLFLDTTPYNAHTTASDALLAGLPVLTCQGKTFPGRVGGSLLHAIGLPELIASSLVEYEEMAAKLAVDNSLLKELKDKLHSNRETYPLFNTKQFCRHLETAYVMMADRLQKEESPACFTVESSSKNLNTQNENRKDTGKFQAKFCDQMPDGTAIIEQKIKPHSSSSNRLQITVMTAASDAYWPLMQYAAPNRLEYCLRHGYQLSLRRHIAITMSQWLEREQYMQDALAECDWLWFLGSDAIITNMTIPLETIIKDDVDFIVANDLRRYADGTSHASGINNDSFLLRNCEASRIFLNTVIGLSGTNHFPNDQYAMEHSMNSTQNFRTTIVSQRVFNSLLYEEFPWIPNENACLCGGSWQPGDFVLHMAGVKQERRLKLLPGYIDKVVR